MSTLREKLETQLWSPPSKNAVERKLLRKVDMVLMPYICLGYFVNYLDRSNLTNAYVTGMREQLHFKGNDFTLAGTLYNADEFPSHSGLIPRSGHR